VSDLAQKRTWLLALAGVALLTALAAGYAVFRTFDDQPYPDPALGGIDAAQLSGPAERIVGQIEGVEVDSVPPWSAILDIRTNDGRMARVVVNDHSELPTEALPATSAGDDSAFPYSVLGFAFDGQVRPVALGVLGLQRWSVLERGEIRHP